MPPHHPQVYHDFAKRLRRSMLAFEDVERAYDIEDYLHGRLMQGYSLIGIAVGRHLDQYDNEVLSVVDGRLPYEAFDALEAEAVAQGRRPYANRAHKCSDHLRIAAGATLVELAKRGDVRADLVRDHAGLCAAALRMLDFQHNYDDGSVLMADQGERITKELAHELWRLATLLTRKANSVLVDSTERIVRCLQTAIERRWLAFPSCDDFDALDRKLALLTAPRASILRNACAECIALIEQANAPRALAVMQGLHTRMGASSSLRALDAELVRRMIIQPHHH
jgi:hypothetical protein